MAKVVVETTEYKHKDGKPRRKLKRTKAKVNGEGVDLRKLAARRQLVPRK